MNNNKRLLSKRLLSMMLAIVMMVGMIAPTLTKANDLPPRPEKTKVVIHKREITEDELKDYPKEHDGENLGTNAPGKALKDIVFAYWKLDDDANKADYANLKTYAEIAKKVGKEGTALTKTDIDGKTDVTLANGKYIFAEMTKPNVTNAVAVPIFLELPALKADGLSWFTETDPLNIYPKNIVDVKGIPLELIKVDEKGAQLEGAKFKLYEAIGLNGTDVNYKELRADIEIGKQEIGLEEGNYKLVEFESPTGYILNTAPIYFSVINGVVEFRGVEGAGEVQAGHATFSATGGDLGIAQIKIENTKATDPTKTIVDPKPADGELIVQVGTKIEYSLKMAFDNTKKYQEFVIYDKNPKNLIFDSLSGANIITDAGKEALDSTDYTMTHEYDPVETTRIIKTIFTLTDSGKAKLNSVVNGKEVEFIVKYIASETMEPGTAETNKIGVKVDQDGNITETEKPGPNVWTGGANFQKINEDPDATNKFVEGAEFTIYTTKAANDGEELTWTKELIANNKAGVGGANATKFKDVGEGNPIIMISDAEGKFSISGLEGIDNATGKLYYLRETKAPDGWIKLKGVVEFGVNKETHLTTHMFKIMNDDGWEIPETGGIGTILFTALGLGLVVFAIKRNSKKEMTK